MTTEMLTSVFLLQCLTWDFLRLTQDFLRLTLHPSGREGSVMPFPGSEMAVPSQELTIDSPVHPPQLGLHPAPWLPSSFLPC